MEDSREKKLYYPAGRLAFITGQAGSGKDTVVRILERHWPELAYFTVSTALDEKYGELIAEIKRTGGMVSNAMTFDAIQEKLRQYEVPVVFVVGAPRNGTQGCWVSPTHAVAMVVINHDIAADRITNRQECRRCRAPYDARIYTNPFCAVPSCKGVLMTRDDDRDPETVKKRLRNGLGLLPDAYTEASRRCPTFEVANNTTPEQAAANLLRRLKEVGIHPPAPIERVLATRYLPGAIAP